MRGADRLWCRLIPTPRRRIVKQLRQVLEEAHVVGEDRDDSAAVVLLLVAGGERGHQPLLRLGAAQEDDALRLGVRRGRTPFHDVVERAQLIVAHRLRSEIVVAARLAQQYVERIARNLGTHRVPRLLKFLSRPLARVRSPPSCGRAASPRSRRRQSVPRQRPRGSSRCDRDRRDSSPSIRKTA